MEFIGPQIWIGTEAASHVFQDLYDIGFKRCTVGKSHFKKYCQWRDLNLEPLDYYIRTVTP